MPVCYQFKCCGSNSSADWAKSVWIRSREGNSRVVPDSCCKTRTKLCGRRDHPSNIYKVEVRGRRGKGRAGGEPSAFPSRPRLCRAQEEAAGEVLAVCAVRIVCRAK